jgi:hypothetical protein
VWTVIHTDSVTRIEREGNLAGLISQGWFRLMEAECISLRIPIEYLCESIPEWIAHVEKVETTRGFGSQQFWNELRVALSLDSIVGCCPLMAPSSFPYASLTGVSPDWGSQQRPSRPIFSLLCASPELQVCIEGHGGDPAESGLIRARMRKREDMVQRLKQKADSICLTADGVVPLDLACPSSREALLGPVGAAYQHSGIVVATDGSLKRCGSMGASFVAKDGRLPARSVAVLGQPSSIRPELTGIALPIEACPSEEDLTILIDSLSAMLLLQSMQRKDFPLSLYRHSVRQLLLHVMKLINQRAAAGSITRLIKDRVHRGGGLNESLAADALASAAAESDSVMPAGI